jgi:hypothetical protein
MGYGKTSDNLVNCRIFAELENEQYLVGGTSTSREREVIYTPADDHCGQHEQRATAWPYQ